MDATKPVDRLYNESMRWVLVGVVLAGCGRVGFSDRRGEDAALTDSVPDVAPDAPPQVIDTLIVPGIGTQTPSAVTLTVGRTYRLRASGTFYIAGGTDPYSDAEYWDFAAGEKDLCDDLVTDAGLSIDDNVVDGAKNPKWGPYRPDHIYEIDFVGKGAPITAMIHDVGPGNNTGSLTLEIIAF